MATKGIGRWAVLIMLSFVVHTSLLINSSETLLWNEQGHTGQLLAKQLADASAPALIARDLVSLSVLTRQYEHQAGIASVRILNTRQELMDETHDSMEGGRLFRENILLESQLLGHAELRLKTVTRSDIIRHNWSNIGLSLLLHVFVFFMGVWLASQRTPQTSSNQKASFEKQTRSSSLPSCEIVETDAETEKSADETTERAAPMQAVSLLHITFNDKNLLSHVSASIADDLLSLFDQFVDRAAQLYGGTVETPFSPDGVLVRFEQNDNIEREFNAIAAASLFLQMIEDVADEREQQGKFCIGAKAAVLHAEMPHESLSAIVAAMTKFAPDGKIICTKPLSDLATRCRFGQTVSVNLEGEGNTIRIIAIETLAPEYVQLVHNQSQRILGIESEV